MRNRVRDVMLPPAATVVALLAISLAHAAEPVIFRSQHLVLHTDLPEGRAKALLDETQKMLDYIAAHWKRSPRGVIDCYVVDNLSNWGGGGGGGGEGMRFPGPAVQAIERDGGVTLTEMLRFSRGFQARATVYASAKGTSAKHEVVHAYCRQTFGEVGPLWYAEGMAELGQHWREGQRGVDCEQHVARHLRQNPPTLDEILEMKVKSGESYAKAWSLCHFMVNHPRYQEQFRQFGLSLLAGKKADFRTVFAKELKRIEFERLLMLESMEVGYRVDLCAWDWDAEFGPPAKGVAHDIQVEAARGWQPTGLLVKAGDRIPYRTKGTWRVEKGGLSLSAEGDRTGRGKLVGVLLSEGRLGEPFELGRQGMWTARSEGQLSVRCQEAFHRLSDNEGGITLTLPQPRTAATASTAPRPEKIKDKTPQKPAAQSAEQQAAAKLRLAKQLLERNPSAAKERFREIIEQYPGTSAAKEAAELLRDAGD